MRIRLVFALSLAVLIPLGSAMAAKDKSGKAKGIDKKDATQVQLSVVFSNHDREIITSWAHDRYGNLPPGLARKGQLPPGLRKQLAKNGTLPPGLEKKIYPLPIELERRLPPIPPDYRRVAIDGSVLIVNRNTRVIADVLVNIAAP